MRHLAVAADSWEELGRPPGELYRGPAPGQGRSSGAPEAPPPSPRPNATSSTSPRRSPRPRREPPRSRSASSAAPTSGCGRASPRWRPCSPSPSSPAPWPRPPQTAPTSRQRRRAAGQGCATPRRRGAARAHDSTWRCCSPWPGPSSTTPPTPGTTSAPCWTARPSSSARPGCSRRTRSPSGRTGGPWQSVGTSPGVTIFDTNTYQEVARNHDIPVAAVRFNPNGTQLAASVNVFMPTGERRVDPVPLRILDPVTAALADTQPGGVPTGRVVGGALASATTVAGWRRASSTRPSWIRTPGSGCGTPETWPARWRLSPSTSSPEEGLAVSDDGTRALRSGRRPTPRAGRAHRPRGRVRASHGGRTCPQPRRLDPGGAQGKPGRAARPEATDGEVGDRSARRSHGSRVLPQGGPAGLHGRRHARGVPAGRS